MADEAEHKEGGKEFIRQVGEKETRKLKAQANATRNIWLGLGMMGLIGWSVVVPTLIGAALGVWLDKRYPANHSWMLTLLIIGLTIGCVNAWHWVAKEEKEIHWEQEEADNGVNGDGRNGNE